MRRIFRIFLVIFTVFLMSLTVLADDTSGELSVRYFVDGSLVVEQTYNDGDIISPPNVSCESGYAITSWRMPSGDVYDFKKPLNDSLTLHADVALLPALANIDGFSSEYDGEWHILSPSSLYHPLESRGGYFTFSWYKDGVFIGSEDSLEIKNVSDSGEYSLKIGFHIDGDESVILYEGLSVELTPKSVAVPCIEPIAYTGELTAPDVPESPLYSFERVFVRNVGDYFLKLTLNDSENYRWESTDESEVFVAFKVITPETSSQVNGEPEKPSDSMLSYGAILFLLSLLFASGALVMMIIARRNTQTAQPPAKCLPKNKEPSASEPVCEEFDEPEFSIQLYENEHDYLDGIGSARANLLISDSMAKNLIQKSSEPLFVSGSLRTDISLGEISNAFSEGETVNIETLTERGIIDRNVGFVRITGEGIIDKPLKIYANDFTLTAVKMIALSGGEVFRCNTKRY